MLARIWYGILIFMNVFNLSVDVSLSKYNFFTLLDLFFFIFFSYFFLKTFEEI